MERGERSARVLPIAWGPAGLEAIIEGELVIVAPDMTHAWTPLAFLDEPYVPGAPRSPDGKTYVADGSGLFVRGEMRARLLRASEFEGTYAEEQSCAVSNDATHVACVHAGGAWVGTWDKP